MSIHAENLSDPNDGLLQYASELFPKVAHSDKNKVGLLEHAISVFGEKQLCSIPLVKKKHSNIWLLSAVEMDTISIQSQVK